MKVAIRDPASVLSLRPLEVVSYLRSTGWQRAEFHEGRFAVWTFGEDYEALLPLRTDQRDYALRMGELLGTLSQVEDRSQLEVLRDLLVTGADVIRIRLADGDLADGSMPIEEHSNLAQKARDLMLAAACSAIEPRAIWRKRKPDQAVDYLRGVRVGQSERGSYVMTVHSRVPPKLAPAQANLFGEVEEEEPYERLVTSGLANALQAVEQAAELSATDGLVCGFDEAVRKGVSANLCEAVSGLASDGDGDRLVEFGFSWSRSRPVAPEQVSRVALPADRAPYVREAARLLRERAPTEDFDLEGAVIKLERPEGATIGQVTVYGIVDDRSRRVTVALGDEEYHQAVNAHDRGQAVRCSGRLVRQGRGYRLENPVGFEVQAED